MNRNAGPPLHVVYSTVSAAAVADIVAARYSFGEPLECQLLRRGFNDMFSLRAPDGERYVARLSRRRQRGGADVAAETAFLAYLDAAGVPVAAAVPAQDGALFTEISAPEGQRPMVVFRHAAGRPARQDAPEDAFAQGVTLARIHDAAEGYGGREGGQYRLDLDHLLHRQLAVVSELDALSAETRDYLAGLASRLSASVAALDTLTWTRCHGDCHGSNAHIAGAGTAVFYDFDDGGFGYLAYDLAVYLWAQVSFWAKASFERRGFAMWHAFIQGYRSVRPISRTDFEAVHLFVPIRHVWLMGEYAAHIAEWGAESVPGPWLEQQANFLRRWEAERLCSMFL